MWTLQAHQPSSVSDGVKAGMQRLLEQLTGDSGVSRDQASTGWKVVTDASEEIMIYSISVDQIVLF